MLWFFSACVESRVIVRKEYTYLLLFAKLLLHYIIPKVQWLLYLRVCNK